MARVRIRAFCSPAAGGACSWTPCQAGRLQAVESSPQQDRSLVWAHGLGGSCVADDVRGLTALLEPTATQRRVLRLDLRGHGRSASAHDDACGLEQYTWSRLAADFQEAALPGSVFGGEASGSAVALSAAVAATTAETAADAPSPVSPSGLILMRPPNLFGTRTVWNLRYEQAARCAEDEGLSAETTEGEALPRLLSVTYAAAGRLLGAKKDAPTEASQQVLEEWRQLGASRYAMALRGLAASEFPSDQELQRLTVPTLILAVSGDDEHPLEAAEDFAAMLPKAQLDVARSMEDARTRWGKRIADFIGRLG
eukprot:TRINITY_DN50584_c0_g1_i1.p1 TRINITY_DN50584_c0_g1~~TRINITY_DN50584_c0_g1_i1.p1  ORF type:complete len:334 (+),score=75.72 TRINITY_DN50584_c0_g1_i1:71-1003(+)